MIQVKDIIEPAKLSWSYPQPMINNEAVRIVDRETREVINPTINSSLSLGRVNQYFGRVIDIVSGDESEVDALVKEILASIPEKFSLYQNYPNPFNPVTTIQYGLPQPANIRLSIFNILGQEVVELVNGWQDMGFHQVRWQGMNHQGVPVSTGVYFSILTNGHQVEIRKMLLVK